MTKQAFFIRRYRTATTSLSTGILLAFSGVLLADASEANAFETRATTREVEPTVVVSTRTPLPLDRVAPSVSVTDGATLDAFQIRDFAAALGREAGFSVATAGAPGAQTSIFVRGTNSNHTSFFLNGRRLNPGLAGNFNLPTIPFENPGSVQIARGPSSVLFGAEGIGGSVDLRQNLPHEGSAGFLEGEVGSYAYRRTRFGLQVAEEALRFGLSGSFLETDNARDNNAYQRTSVVPQLEYVLSDAITLELVSSYVESDLRLPGNRFNPTPLDFQEDQSWLLSPGIRIENDDHRFQFFYARSEATITGFTFGTLERLTFEADELNAQYDWQAQDALLLSVGALLRDDTVERFDVSTQSQAYRNQSTQAGIFLQGQYTPSELWEFRLGGRADRYSDYGNPLTGSAEVLLHLPAANLTLFTRVASAFAPPPEQTFAFGAEGSLDPEKTTSYEIGLRQSLREDSLQWTATVFRNDVKDLIDFEFNFDPITSAFTSTAFNARRATTEGLETSVQWSPTEYLSLSGNYTYLHAIDQDASDRRLLRRPRHLVNLALSTRPHDRLRMGLEGQAVIDRKDVDPQTFASVNAPDYLVFRLVGEWQLNDTFSLFGRVENLLDKDYESILGFPALGRTGYIGLNARF